MQEHAIKDNFQYTNRSSDIGPAVAVRAKLFQTKASYFVAAKIFTPNGPPEGIGPGVWFMVGSKNSPENVFAINSYANQYSTWPSGEKPELLRYRFNDPTIKITMNDSDARIAFDCASNILDKQDSMVFTTSSSPSSQPTSLPINPTYTPRSTSTFVPTITPTHIENPDLTVTSIPSGGPILVNNWLIEIDKIEILEELIFYDEVRRNENGRFVVLFLLVSNVGQNKDDFVGSHAYLDIVDAESRLYEESAATSFIARVMYNQELGGGLGIEPGMTRNYIVVYDISEQSDYYHFSPGNLAEKISGNLELNIP
jgi:hypothetical protein